MIARIDTPDLSAPSPADLLRAAATRIRETAQRVTDGDELWYVEADISVWRCSPDGMSGDGITGPLPIWAHGYAEHIVLWQPIVALAVADMLDGAAMRHRPRQNTSGLPDACPECVGGKTFTGSQQARPCGCWGLSEPICGTCSQEGSAVRRYPKFWPCEDFDAALALARLILGGPK